MPAKNTSHPENDVTSESAAVTTDTLSAFAREIAAAFTASQPIRRKTIAEIKFQTAFNPEGKPNRELAREVYINGMRPSIDLLTDEEIALLDRLPAGNFLNGRVKVVTREPGDGSVETMLWYPNRTLEDRLQNAQLWKGFADLLSQITAEGGAR